MNAGAVIASRFALRGWFALMLMWAPHYLGVAIPWPMRLLAGAWLFMVMRVKP